MSKPRDFTSTTENYGTDYSLSDYGDMISDSRRVQAYVSALEAAIKPGCTVLDIGAGTGFFSILACRFGAGQVIAIEPNPAIRIGKEIAKANGFAERIQWIENLSTKVSLDTLADVLISDLRGSLPLFRFNLATILDAHRRLLAPNADIIPAGDRLFIAPVEAPSIYNRLRNPWGARPYQLDLSAALRCQLNRMHKARFRPEHLIGKPVCWFDLNYGAIKDLSASGSGNWKFDDARTLQGFALWFETDLGHGHGFSNEPGQPELIYTQSFLPLLSPINLEIGDQLSVNVGAHWCNNNYVWRWRGTVSKPEAVRKDFDQSTLAGKLFPHNWQTDYMPMKR